VSEVPTTVPAALVEVVPLGGSDLARPERSVPVTLLPALAAGSFAAGAAAMGLVRRRRARAVGVAGRRALLRGRVGGGERLQIVGTRSLLVDIHLLARPDK
jgi:hypothetical protein